jgi:hypothetical protein
VCAFGSPGFSSASDSFIAEGDNAQYLANCVSWMGGTSVLSPRNNAQSAFECAGATFSSGDVFADGALDNVDIVSLRSSDMYAGNNADFSETEARVETLRAFLEAGGGLVIDASLGCGISTPSKTGSVNRSV